MPTKVALRKTLAFRRRKPELLAEARHVIQVNRPLGRVARWHTIPGLIYSNKELAQDGLYRLQKHSPASKLRVWPHKGENVSVMAA
jgi:hypothetical protein